MTTDASEISAGADNEAAASDQVKRSVDSPVVKMRDTDIKWRSKYKLTKEELEDLRATADRQQKNLQETIDTTLKQRQQVEQKLIDAKLESAAISAGITDLDLVKLIDKSDLKLSESGEISGLQEAVNAFKQSKPNFFEANKKISSSSNAALPSDVSTKAIRARDMSKEDYKALERSILAGNKLN